MQGGQHKDLIMKKLILKLDCFDLNSGDIQIPKLYKFSCHEMIYDRDIYSVVGLHLIVRWIRKAWYSRNAWQIRRIKRFIHGEINT